MAVKIPKFPEKSLYQNHFVYRKSVCATLRANSDPRLEKAMIDRLSYDATFFDK
jgi:hypothetical protein